jgi:predicted nucleic acid-binding protein
MSGTNFANIAFDTNAFIYFISGDKRLFQYSTSTVYISEFTEMELKEGLALPLKNYNS